MYTRSLQIPEASFFLFGPRGTGKSTWLQQVLPQARYYDLLDTATYGRLLAHPTRLAEEIEAHRPSWVVIDEVQRLPSLLHEVHRLIEKKQCQFALTGSSARQLRREGVNLLAGRAWTMQMHPLTALELGNAFQIQHVLRYGCLPSVFNTTQPERYLESYVGTYLREELQAEALVRNIDTFARFLTAASFSQGSLLNMANIARDVGIPRKTVASHFEMLEDLLIAMRLPVFQHKAKRAMTSHYKFYFFDVGVYRVLRPQGPLDPVEEIEGAALETLVMQQLRAINATHHLQYTMSFYRTKAGHEIDFILYGARGLHAIDVKRGSHVREEDLRALKQFKGDYPMAQVKIFYTGKERYNIGEIEVWPLEEAMKCLKEMIE